MNLVPSWKHPMKRRRLLRRRRLKTEVHLLMIIAARSIIIALAVHQNRRWEKFRESYRTDSLDTRYLVRFNYDWSLSLDNILDHPSAFTGFVTTETATNIRIEWTYYFLTTRHLFYWWRKMGRGRDKQFILLMGRN